MASKALKMLIISANCADVDLSQAHIDAFAKDSGFNNGDYDIVAVGEQETKGSKKHSYIADRLAATKPNDYTFGADDKSPKGKSRITLTGTMGTGKHQSLGVIWKKSIDNLIGSFDEKTRKEGKIKGYAKAKGIWHTGKGGVVLNLVVGNDVIAIGSCHLNDEADKKRQDELSSILGAMPGTAVASFIMGDLNYRPKCLFLKDKGDPKKSEDYKALSVDEFFNMLLDKNAKMKFMNMNDPVTNKEVKAPGFTWAPVDFFPTYKRVQGVALLPGAKLADLKKAYWSKCAGPKRDKSLPYSDPLVTSVMDKRAGDYGIGWLDRIGYKGKVTDVASDALHSITVSDHTPIIMSCKVTVEHD